MDYSTALAFSLPIGLGIAAFGAGLGLGRAVGSALEATGRQPEAGNQIFKSMLIGCALIEALGIYAFVVVFLLMGKIGPVAH